jgi:hypothetical protein
MAMRSSFTAVHYINARQLSLKCRRRSYNQRGAKVNEPDQQAVLIHLDGTSLPDAVYEQCDLAALENDLIAAIEKEHLGEFDGNEMGPAETMLYLYGPDANRLFKGIEPLLLASPLCQNARVVIRTGGPGAPSTEVRLPFQS